MSVIPAVLGGYQPVCDMCGICLCYEVEPENYELHRNFWDNWKCEVCDPDYFKRWKNERRLGLR